MCLYGTPAEHCHQTHCFVTTVSDQLKLNVCCLQAAVDGFLEEMIIRRELADNFCFYEPNYDNLKCAAPWASESLQKHSTDKREHLYSKWAFVRSMLPVKTIPCLRIWRQCGAFGSRVGEGSPKAR